MLVSDSMPILGPRSDGTLQQQYYGHTAYLLSTYNAQLKIELPLFLKTVNVKRHDSVTT